jgi:hypothetical protein
LHCVIFRAKFVTEQVVMPPRKSSPCSSVGGDWRKVAQEPERWEHPTLGAVESRGPELWAILPTCGHGYAALGLTDAQRQAEERSGLCYACAASKRSAR